MNTYRVTLTTKDGKYLREQLDATHTNDVRAVMLARYPGCTILHIDKVR